MGMRHAKAQSILEGVSEAVVGSVEAATAAEAEADSAGARMAALAVS